MNSNVGRFRSSAWDPILIISQIVCVSSSYYTLLSILLFFGDIFGKYIASLSQLFEDNVEESNSYRICFTLLLPLLASSIEAYCFPYIVGRAKLCLDFSLTFHFWHLVLVYIHSSMPTSFLWWFTFIVSIVIMTTLGEYFCMKRDMEPIMLNNTRSDANPIPLLQFSPPQNPSKT